MKETLKEIINKEKIQNEQKQNEKEEHPNEIISTLNADNNESKSNSFFSSLNNSVVSSLEYLEKDFKSNSYKKTFLKKRNKIKTLEDRIKIFEDILEKNNKELESTKINLEKNNKELESTKINLEQKNKELELTNINLYKELESTKINLEINNKEIESTKKRLSLVETKLENTENELNYIKSTILIENLSKGILFYIIKNNKDKFYFGNNNDLLIKDENNQIIIEFLFSLIVQRNDYTHSILFDKFERANQIIKNNNELDIDLLLNFIKQFYSEYKKENKFLSDFDNLKNKLIQMIGKKIIYLDVADQNLSVKEFLKSNIK